METENVFNLVYTDDKKIIVEVCCDNPLAAAMYPYVNTDWEYIVISGYPCQIGFSRESVKVVKHDGSSFSYGRGALISENLRQLNEELKNFLRQNNIRLC